jgi:hypothetical protein
MTILFHPINYSLKQILTGNANFSFVINYSKLPTDFKLSFQLHDQHDFRDRFTRQSKNQKFSGGDRILKDAKKLSTLKATKVNILPKK